MANQEDGLIIPISVTEKQYAQQLARLEANTVRTAKRAETSFNRANRPVARLGREFRKTTGAANHFSGGMRNTAMQLSQVAQMGSVTGDYVRALSIQLPDLALGFGAVGIAIGAVAGSLAPLAVDMLTGADASKELQDQLKGLEEAMKRLQAAETQLGAGTIALREDYGGLAEDARKLFEIERQIADIRARASLNDVARGLGDSLGIGGVIDLLPEQIKDISGAMGRLIEERDRLNDPSKLSDVEFAAADRRISVINEEIAALSKLNRNLDEVADMFGITEVAAQEVVRRFVEIASAEGPEQQAIAMRDLADYISDASDNLVDAEEEGQALFDRLLQAAQEAFTLAGIDYATGIGRGADEAARLADNLALAARGQELLAGMRGNPDFADPRNEAGVSGRFDYTPPPLGLQQVRLGPVRRDGASRRGGAGNRQDAELNRLLRERDRILSGLETATERYASELADLNKLKEMGEINSEDYARALAKIDEQLVSAEFGNVVRGIESISDAIANAIVNGEDLGDALGQVFRQIVAELLASNIRNLLMQTFNFGGIGGGGGIFGSIFGALFGGGRAAGGPVMPGQIYAVNENTPNTEFFAPNVAGQILTASQVSAAAPRSGSQAVVIGFEQSELRISDGGEVTAMVRLSAQQSTETAVRTVRTSLNGWQDTLRQDGALV